MNFIEATINFLDEHKILLAAAESCTAGMVTSLLADIPGCGSVLEAGYVVYSEQAKNSCLGVNLQTIKSFGLTSEPVAREMALGALNCSRAHLSIAVTGTAESNDELNGVVCFAYALRSEGAHKLLSETVSFEGDRNAVRKLAAMHVISSIPLLYPKLLSSEDRAW